MPARDGQTAREIHEVVDVINLGPLAFAIDRLIALVLLLGFALAFDHLQRGDHPTDRVGAMLVIGVGITAARFGFVMKYADAFAQDWFSILAIWQGGFLLWTGLAGAALLLVYRLRPWRRLAQGLALLASAGALWLASAALLHKASESFPGFGEIVTLDGQLVTAHGLGKGPYVINLWASWCPPCRRELPMLAQLAAKSKVPVLLVNEGETPAHIRHFLARQGISHAMVLLDRDSRLMRALDAQVLPVTLFVGADGQIAEFHVGEISRAQLAAGIAQVQGD